MSTGTEPGVGCPVEVAEAERRWWRNQLAVTGASLIGFTGFTLVMPFLPLFIGELGEHDVAAVAAWTGLSIGITPAITAVLSPAWGRVADRFGRKLMVERSLASFVVVMSAMAFVTRPWQIFALRAVQGLFAGYGGLTIAMAAESAPPARLATSIGLVQTAQRLGPAIGPVIGGVVASIVGLRQAFFVTAAIYAVALGLVMALYREPPSAGAAGRGARAVHGWGSVVRLPNFLLMAGVIFGLQVVDRSLAPILPIYLGQIGVAPERVAALAGVLFSVWAAMAAAGHHVGSRLLARWPAKVVIVGGATVAAVGVSAVGLVAETSAVATGLALLGIGIGMGMTAAFASAGSVIPAGSHGSAFGLLTAASMSGLAISPMASGAAAGWSLQVVFVVDVVVLLGLVWAVRRLMREQTGEPTDGPGPCPPEPA